MDAILPVNQYMKLTSCIFKIRPKDTTNPAFNNYVLTTSGYYFGWPIIGHNTR